MPVIIRLDRKSKIVLFHLLLHGFQVFGWGTVNELNVSVIHLVAVFYYLVDFVKGAVAVLEIVIFTIRQIKVLLANLLLHTLGNPPHHPLDLFRCVVVINSGVRLEWLVNTPWEVVHEAFTT